MSSQIQFLAPSSSGGEYVLTLAISSGRALIRCECQAAESMLMCKHRIALLQGDTTKLSGDLRSLPQTLMLPEVAALRKECDAALAQIAALDGEKKRIEAEQKKIKKDLAWRVTTGVWKANQ